MGNGCCTCWWSSLIRSSSPGWEEERRVGMGWCPPPEKAGEMAHAARTHCSDFSKLFCISIFILLHPITSTAIGVFPYFGYSKWICYEHLKKNEATFAFPGWAMNFGIIILSADSDLISLRWYLKTYPSYFTMSLVGFLLIQNFLE